jgi:thioredoxin 1
VNDSSFEEEVIKSTIPVLVKFGAEWCGPCHRMAPILQQFARENSNTKVVNIDIDDSPLTTSKFGIMSVPTIMIFKDGKSVGSKVGLVPPNVLSSFVTEKLNG